MDAKRITASATVQTLWKRIGLVGHVLLFVVICTLAQSILWSPDANVILILLVVGIGLTSFWKPESGLLAVAVLAPLGLVINRALDSDPIRISESFVLAFLTGVMLRNILSRTPKQDHSSTHHWLYLLLLIVIGSCTAQLLTQQLWQNYPLAFAEQVFAYLATGYHGPVGDLRIWIRPANFEYIATTILFVTGILLAVLTETTIGRNQQTARKLAAAIVLGACIASASSAILGIQAFETDGLATTQIDPQEDGVTRTFISMITSDTRWAGFTGKVSSAGSFLVLVVGLAIGGVARHSRYSLLWIIGAVVTTLMLLLSGSRAALGAAIVTVTALYGFHLVKSRSNERKYLMRSAFSVIVLIGIAVVFRWEALTNYLPTVLQHRWGLMVASARMLASEPLFGVGISQFYPLSQQFSPEYFLILNDSTYLNARTNAHNYFLQVAAELGIFGFIAFVLSLYGPLRASFRHIMSRQNSWFLTGTFAGVICFLLTCLTGQPLVIAIAGYPFWIALGLLGALNNMAPQVQHSDTSSSSQPTVRNALTPYAVVIAGLLIVTTLTLAKASKDRNDIDLTRIDYGFYDWETDGGIASVPFRVGTEYRWSRGDATIFLPQDTVQATIPLRAAAGFSGQATTVNIRANGLTIDSILLENNLWHQVVVPLNTRNQREFARLDFNISPTWMPSAVDPNSSDHRQLGVMIGEIKGQTKTGEGVLISDPFP